MANQGFLGWPKGPKDIAGNDILTYPPKPGNSVFLNTAVEMNQHLLHHRRALTRHATYYFIVILHKTNTRYHCLIRLSNNIYGNEF